MAGRGASRTCRTPVSTRRTNSESSQRSTKSAAARAGEAASATFSSEMLLARAVVVHDVELGRVDAVEAARIDGHHRRAVGLPAARERGHAARRAEQVVDDHPVELVAREVTLASLQREALRGHEGQERALLAAHRAVA